MSLLKDPNLNLSAEIILLPSGAELRPFSSLEVPFEAVLRGSSDDRADGYSQANSEQADRCNDFIQNGVLHTTLGVGYYVYCIIGGRYAGNVSIDLIHSPANISIELSPEYRGMGFGTEIYRTLIKWVGIQTRITLLSHVTRTTNTPSRKLAERVGGILQDSWKEEDTRRYLIPIK